MTKITNSDDRELAEQVGRAFPGDGTAPDFSVAWNAAQARQRTVRRRYAAFAAAAAITAIAVVAFNIGAPQRPDVSYIADADLLGSTTWVAPSDSLLPQHTFDIYQDLPELADPLQLRSTNPADGALL